MKDSLWRANVELPQFPVLAGDVKTDVLIVGGGLAGLLCAYELGKAGVEYILIEGDRICQGITRNTTAKLTSQHGLIYSKLLQEFDADTARLYWLANEGALEKYRALAEKIDCDFETKDHFLYTVETPEKLGEELAALKQAEIPADFVDGLDIPLPVSGAICFRNQAQFHPLKFAAGIASGLTIYEQTKALAFEGNTVITNRGRIAADRVIVATHFPILNKHGSYFLKMYQQRSYVLALEGAGSVEGMSLDSAQKGMSFRSYDGLLLLGGGGHRTGKQGGGWEKLEAFARQHFPDTRERFRWAAQDCMTLDGIPYIGQYSKATPKLYVATGFNKWGMTSSMVAAMLLKDLLTGKENPYASVFSPQRTVLRPQLVKNVLESTVNLVTPTKPRCPHLGCALKWNRQEHSWDCPCHGSRFSGEGHLLDNPATADMKNSRSQ